MSKPQSGKPANTARRPTRRSIVDLTEAARRAADDGVVPTVVTAVQNQPLPADGETIASDAIDDGTGVSTSSWPGLSRLSTPSPAAQMQDVDARHPSTPEASPGSVSVRRSASEAGHKAGHDESVEAVGHVSRSEPVARLGKRGSPAASSEGENPELPHPAASGSCRLNASDSSADMAVKIAKAYQAGTLDDIKAGFNAALDYAAEFSRRGASSEAAMNHSPEDSGTERRNALTAQYRAEAARLMTANMATTMDFARRLLGAKTSGEWVELTSTHARQQCELMLQQARALRSLARRMTDSDADEPTPGDSTEQK